MSVTIVTTLPRPTQATTTDKAANSDNATSGDNTGMLDFASLLQGQLQPILPVALETIQKTTDQTDPTIAESAPSDAAALLAALGLIPQEPSGKADSQKVEEISPMVVPGSTPIATHTTAVIAQSPKLVGNAKNTKSEETSLLGISKGDKAMPESASTSLQKTTFTGSGLNLNDPVNTDTVPPEANAIEGRPAKFAAVTAIAPTTENASTKIASAEMTQSSIPALVSNSPGSPNTTPIRHEVSLSVPTLVRDQGWASDFGQKIVWLAGNDKQSAQITLNPPQMGPIEISLSLDKGSATASFTSANSEVRNALETAMPKLREMFASAGIELGQTNVSAESFRQQAENGNGNRGSSQWRSDNAILVADSAISLSARAFSAQQGNGLVDTFA